MTDWLSLEGPLNAICSKAFITYINPILFSCSEAESVLLIEHAACISEVCATFPEHA